MVIKKLILYKYKRFFLTGITKLTYEPEKTMQIIVSKNGAGKSSLLAELNPLPADIKKNYYDDGYKYIEILHYGKQYIISSGKTGHNKHSMVLNNIELNPGGTRKVQLELVKEHFGLTPNIIDILLNHTKLTTMSIPERKRWLSEISTIDYEYPIVIYNKLKSKHRDLIGGIKLIENEIISLSNNKLNLEQLNNLKEQKKYISNLHNHILSLYQHQSNHNYNIDYDILNYLNKEIITTTTKLKSIRDINTINKDIEEANRNYSIIDTEIKNTVKIIDDLEKILGIEHPDKLKLKITNLQQELKKITIDDKLVNHIDKLSSWLFIYQESISNIIPLINNLTELDQFRLMEQEQQKNILIKYSKLELTLSTINNTINRLTDQLDKLNQGQDIHLNISCPHCSTEFSYNIIEHKKSHILTELELLQNDKKKHELEYHRLLKIKNGIEEKNQIIKNILNIVGHNLTIKPIWELLFNKIDLHKTSLESITRELDSMLINLEHWSKSTKIYEEIKYLEQQSNIYNDLKTKNGITQQDKLEEYNTKLSLLTKKKNDINLVLEALKEENTYTNKFLTHLQQLHNSLLDIRNKNKHKIIDNRNSYLGSLTDELSVMMIDMDNRIREQDNIISNIESRNNILKKYKEEEHILDCMVKALSPTEGLIAKSINSFLQVFVKEMNTIINKIWSYELELLPCDIGETNDLDYKFRVKVNNDQIIEDVSRLSTGMKEIVDLAFRIVFCKYKGLLEIPLFLDEFGHGFDKNHRTIAYSVIDKILSSDYPQVFIVCHYESLYGSFKNVDFNILDGDSDHDCNKTFNNRLVIEY